MTQAELAKKIGTKQSVISRIENGQGTAIPSIETLAKIGSALTSYSIPECTLELINQNNLLDFAIVEKKFTYQSHPAFRLFCQKI